ncbi:uncharacterized protein LOC144927195 [Branchiostoma floridae x Branchiostoma belcheri]
MADRRHITLCVTPAGEEYIRGFIQHYGFEEGDVVEVNSGPHHPHPDLPADPPPGEVHPDPDSDQDDPPPPAAGEVQDDPPAQHDADQAGPANLIPQADGVEECRRCLCRPCVTTPEPLWLGEQPACEANAGLRKEKYKNFWAIMANMDPSPWYDARYRAKRERRLAEDAERAPDVRRLVTTGRGSARDIMPKCVLKLVRAKFPNPPGKPYLGHKWL